MRINYSHPIFLFYKERKEKINGKTNKCKFKL